MRNPQWAIDLHTFPRDAKNRFVDSVLNGKRNMPPWDDLLKPTDLDALWAYVATGDPGDQTRSAADRAHGGRDVFRIRPLHERRRRRPVPPSASVGNSE